MDATSNPLEPSEALKAEAESAQAHGNPQQSVFPGDSATTKAEKIERHGDLNGRTEGARDFQESPRKRVKLDHDTSAAQAEPEVPVAGEVKEDRSARQKGVAPIKKEYLVDVSTLKWSNPSYDDDAAEAGGKSEEQPIAGRGGKKGKQGQNKARTFGSSRDAIALCRTRHWANEFDPVNCPFGEKCRMEHDIRKYLNEGKREDMQTFGGMCPNFETNGKCKDGWKCRWASSHSNEIEREDGRKELVQIQKEESNGNATAAGQNADDDDQDSAGVVNLVSNGDKITLRKKKWPTPQSDTYLKWLNSQLGEDGNKIKQDTEDNRAAYTEPPLRPSEKRRIYYGPETPVLAPLTTQGNLPFRRLCTELGAQVTWSEMAMGLPLLNGEKGEWALVKAHESELAPPAYFPKNPVQDYDNSKDIRFGVQIAANKPWLAMKTTEVLTALCPQIRAIDLNCGCPIDLVFRTGAGSALLDAHGKLEKTLRGMNTVSGEIPITVKIRMGTKDKHPNATKLVERLVLGGLDAQEAKLGPAGVAAITLHGRSRQQRYTRDADWGYIAECASLVKSLKAKQADLTDTAREPDARDMANTSDGLPYFCGNGDILCPGDYNTHIEQAKVDSIMIGRGALVKPWIFEEIQQNQDIDKSASERLAYIERFCRNGLEYWGSDEVGVGNTRRFLLEWLSFSCRYVPIGLLEYMPPKFGDRPPAFHGRSDLETLLSSGNYKDWIKISELFLGPAHKDFQFQPKHKSNSYEIEAEG
ncbi:Putative Zinc finger, CCCH-type, aldolase-type TIM barrel, tRNA-dihydrouridine synthase [Septoria linicola]|uniref:tRNA-dihydrouridine(47) synthase [NAD(P)(+)] n=1 Tax=Septoria linicola TaxID=215465 RepID=A0A9Q9EFL8_9PEZI|nr:Putative Zinc finger, CCCH-type, aldolase-type TIM barrel, tRNA-dihydrouridine synthase [Septoria linicola]